MPTVIQTEGLTKVYEGALRSQDVLALKDLNIQVNEGEIFGFLGPNGSGKTTTIKMLLGLLFPTEGSITLLEKYSPSDVSVRKSIGYLPEGAYYPDFLRGDEILRFFGNLYGLGGKDLEKRIDEALETVGMAHARRRMIRGYSKGMRQRIGLAQALLSDPAILILDEPTTGLDPVARKEMRDLLMMLRDRGKTLFISSHELLEVEMISNRVGILFEGALQTVGTIDELLLECDMSVKMTAVTDEAIQALEKQNLKAEDRVGDRATILVPTEMSLYDAIDKCRAANLKLVSVSPRRETLEELFVRVVGTARDKKEQNK